MTVAICYLGRYSRWLDLGGLGIRLLQQNTCTVKLYMPLGLGHTSSYTDRYLKGRCSYVLLKPLCCFCLGIRYNSGYRDPGKLRDVHGLGSTQ